MVKIGLEIHQRLGTEHKLFCNCASVSGDAKSGEMKRRLHAVASELGEVDVAARFESEKDSPFVYDKYERGSCLVEMDDEPPGDINRDAIDIVLTICVMTNARTVDEIHIMRKTVIDGSNTSGFQRTAIVGLDGTIDLDNKQIGLQTIALEEESCGIVGELAGKTDHFRLDRLGIPLVEIATEPTITSGEEAGKVAEKIGLMLRATGRMMRGIGTIRQDINISREGGARVEIKGVQSLDLIETVVDNELERQKSLIEIIKKMKGKRNELNMIDATSLFKETGSKFIKNAIARGEKVITAKFSSMNGIFGTELYKDFRYGTELSGYAKANGAGGIIHSDEDMKRYGFGNEINELTKLLKIGKEDGWIAVVGTEEVCHRALKAVDKRAYLKVVPEETRRPDAEGRSYYMRPLPGAARMYPETDVRPFRVTDTHLKIASEKTVSFDEIKRGLYKDLNAELAEKMLRSEKLELYNELIGIGVDPTLCAVTLEDTLKSLKREGSNTELVKNEKIVEMFDLFMIGKFVKAAIPEIIKESAKNPQKEIEIIIREKRLEKISGKELNELLKHINSFEMSQIMAKYRLNIDPEELKRVLSRKRSENSRK